MTDQVHRDFRRIRHPLEGRLVRLRAVEEADLPRINLLFNDPDVLQFLDSVIFPGPIDETREWWESSGEIRFAIETLAGQLVGACSLEQVSARTRAGTLGIWIGKPFWNNGFGTDAVTALCRFAFQQMNLQRIELHVHTNNPRGQRAYEKVGFKEEGRLRRANFVGGEAIDTVVMGLLAEELIEP